MYFDFDYYKDKKVAIHCSSKTQAKKFCKLMHKNGMKWMSGKSYNKITKYNDYRENTCYFLHGTYKDINWVMSQGYTIIEFEDIIAGKYDRRQKMFTKKDLKNGDYVKCRNGENYIYVEVGSKGYFINNDGFNPINIYRDDLIFGPDDEWDIVEVRRGWSCGINPAFCEVNERYIIYKRQEEKLWNGMTYEEAHRKLWNALADGEVKNKQEWFDLNNKNKENLPLNKCFACELGLRKTETNVMCSVCPINKSKCQPCLGGLYDKWQEAKGFEKFKLAHEIANLPWED